MNISIIGLGLIGASIAKSIKKYTEHTVIGFDTNIDVLNRAMADGSIDKIGDDNALGESDVTVIAIYPAATIEFVKNKARYFKKGSIVTDTCGIKRDICKTLTDVADKNGFTFIGAHPMAGKETSGYESSDADLFKNAFMILVPQATSKEQVSVLEKLSYDMGFKGVTVSTPEEHDRIIAYTSQLPHILACCYISDPDAVRHSGFSAGSYKDVSRVATINAKMWRELFLQNSDYLTGHIDMLVENLNRMKTYIDNAEGDKLEKMLDDGDKIKRRIG